ncbi:MAG: hypothetical protein DU429_05560 [Candidatus Tokpelaia sp.]|nr:MAG: hypothetical protein DU430_04785 [Candidatus Tokpelaia sp.]KAA6206800.1 MAG: hypothetical protein DU429_05560 [Candidatus Tokpelaia sp.]
MSKNRLKNGKNRKSGAVRRFCAFCPASRRAGSARFAALFARALAKILIFGYTKSRRVVRGSIGTEQNLLFRFL